MRRSHAGLAALAAAAVAASAWAVYRAEYAPPAESGATSGSAQVDQSAATAARGQGWTLTDARERLDDGATVTVLGDSTGDESDEWVALWSSERTDVEVVNASVPGSRAGDVLGRVATVVPADTDLVLLNYGHNHTTGDVGQVAELLDEVAAHAPGAVPVVVLQQPQTGDANADVRRAVAEAADRAGVPVIDVAAAFEEDGRDLGELLSDDVHPNPEGSRVWADAVADALG